MTTIVAATLALVWMVVGHEHHPFFWALLVAALVKGVLEVQADRRQGQP